MKIIAYIRTSCKWSDSVCEILDKYELPYDKRNISTDAGIFEEMVRNSGQRHAPCVEIDGVMLADVRGEDVENYLLSHELVEAAEYQESSVPAEADGEGKGGVYFKMTPPTKFF